MKRLLFLLGAVTLGAAQAATVEQVTDLNAVLGLMRGNVQLVGDKFGSVGFQRGVLNLAQSGAIRVQVLTTKANAANMKPLKAVGARVNTFGGRFTGSLILVENKAVIFPVGNAWRVLHGSQEAAQMAAVLAPYWQTSKPY